MTKAAPNPLLTDLDELGRLYQLLAAKVEPGQGEGGRRPQPASRPPLQIPPVSLMDEIQRTISYLIGQARFTLLPVIRINITDRTGANCPYCAGELVAWLYGDNPEPPEVLCLGTDHPAEEPKRWEKSQWARLGVLTGVREDRRFGPRLPDVASG